MSRQETPHSIGLENLLFHEGRVRSSQLGARIGHFIVCLFMALFLVFFLWFGGWLMNIVVRMAFAMLVLEFVDLVGVDAHIGPFIWVPAAIVLGLIWCAIFVPTTVWLVCFLICALLGMLTAASPMLSRNARIIAFANLLTIIAFAVTDLFRLRRLFRRR